MNNVLLFGKYSGPKLAGWVEAKFAKEIMEGCRDAEEAFSKLDADMSGELSPAEFVMGEYRAVTLHSTCHIIH